jgi:hypothetical protein
VRRIVTVLYAANAMTSVAALVLAYRGPTEIRAAAFWATSACRFAALVLAMVWLYAAWRGVPASHRGTVSPRRAAFSLLVPFYNVYWGIAVNLALCDTLNGVLRGVRSERRAPRAVLAAAAITWLGSYVVGFAVAASHRSVPLAVSLLVSGIKPGLWVAYMMLCEPAFAAVAALGDPPQRLGAPRLSQLQRERGPGAFSIVAWYLLVVFALACWQVLQPGERPARDTSSSDNAVPR